MQVDLFPPKKEEELFQEVLHLAQEEPKKALKNVLKKLVPERLLPLLLEKADLNEDVTYDNLPKVGVKSFAQLLKVFPIYVNGTLSIEEAFVTGGGVDIKEIYPKTMESRKIAGLFFCGEILDIHGYTGGYNITCAFSTGYVAGKSAAEKQFE